MEQFIGILIRRERLRQNYSQEGLCRGICAVSYLSKIEQGKVQAGTDVVLPLLRRLGVDFETDEAFLSWAGSRVEILYRELLAGREKAEIFRRTLAELEREEERCLRSPWMLDLLLLEAGTGEAVKADLLEQAEPFSTVMDQRQYPLYLLCRLNCGWDQDAGPLLRLGAGAFYTVAVGNHTIQHGRYTEAVALLRRGYDQAAEEGRPYLMLLGSLLLGNCYSAIGHRGLMMEHYQVARRLGEELGQTELLAAIDYNIAATYLEWGMDREALTLLEAAPREDLWYWHKLAIALERAGRLGEARAALVKAYGDSEEFDRSPAVEKILDLVAYRLDHPDYVRRAVYADMAREVCALSERELGEGYARFHLPALLEALEAQRRYKEAYQLMKEFSYKERRIED